MDEIGDDFLCLRLRLNHDIADLFRVGNTIFKTFIAIDDLPR